jgi:hypothetical protein
MDRRRRGGSVYVVVFVLVGAVVAAFLVLRFAFPSDYERSPIDLGDWDAGARVYVEPDDEFEVHLLGHPAHEDAAWVIAELDETVIDILSSKHEPRGTEPPDAGYLARTPEVVRELWSTLPDPGRPPDVVEEGMGEMWLWPLSIFSFAGRDLGESEVRLELRVEGELIHSFEFGVTVVDGDACDYFVSQESSTKVPHRCG